MTAVDLESQLKGRIDLKGSKLVAEAKTPKEKEAAQLYKTAEEATLFGEDPLKAEEALEKALKCAALYKEIGDVDLECTGLLLVIKAYLTKAELFRGSEKESDRNAVSDMLKAAEAVTQENMAKFRSGGHKLAEAKMMQSFADINLDRRGLKKRDEAQQMAYAAKRLAKEVGDKETQARSTYALMIIFIKSDLKYEALEAAEETLQLFQALGDRQGEAKSSHMLGLTRMHLEDLEGALDASRDALEIYAELGDRRNAAFENYCMSAYLSHKGKHSQSLSYAREALDIFQEINYTPSWMAGAYGAVMQAELGCNRKEEASRVAEESLEAMGKCGDRRAQVNALTYLVQAAMAQNDLDSALQHAEEAVGLCMDIKDRDLEATVLNEIARVHLAKQDVDMAKSSAQDALAICRDLVDKHREGIVLGTLIEVASFEGDMQSLKDFAEEQREIYRELGKKAQEADAVLNLAAVAANTKGSAESMELVEEAKAIFQEASCVTGEAAATQQMGDLYLEMREYEPALAAMEEAKKLLKNVDFRLETKAAQLVSNTHWAFSEFPKASKAAQEAYKLARKSKDKYLEVDILLLNTKIQVELACINSGDAAAKPAEKASKLTKEAMAIAKRLQDKQLAASCMLSLSKVHTLYGRISDALKVTEEALDIFRKGGNHTMECGGLICLAQVHLAAEQKDRAKELAQEAAAKAKEINDRELMASAAKLIETIEGPVLAPAAAGAPAAAEAPTQVATVAQAAPEAAAESALTREAVLASVQEMVKASIGDDGNLEADLPFMDAGMDSLTAVSFRSGLQQQLGVKLPSSLVFDFPTIQQVTDRVLELAAEG